MNAKRSKSPRSKVEGPDVGTYEQAINISWTLDLGPRTQDLGPRTLVCFFANPFPRTLEVAQFGVCLADAHAQRETIIEARVCQIKIAAPVQPIH